MKSKLLMISTAALLASTFAATGQSIQPGGTAQEKPQQGSSQGLKSNEGTRDQAPNGQAQHSRDEDRPGQVQREPDKKGQTRGQAQRDQDKLKGQTQRDQDKKGQAQRDQDRKGQTQGQAQRDQDRQRAGQIREQDRSQGQNQREQDRAQGERDGQRSGNVSVTFTTEQRTKIRETVFKGSNAPRVSNVNFSINVGTVVPRTVRIIEIPEVIVDIHPEWRGYRYFIVNDELVVVEPDTLRIVAVIDV